MFDLITSFAIRANDALTALAIMICVHCLVMAASIYLKKHILIMPIIEHTLRPIIITLIDRLNRRDRTDFALIIRGAIIFFCILIVLTITGIVVENALAMLGFGAKIDVVLLCLVIAPLAVLQSALSISKDKPHHGAYQAIARALNQNLIPADKHGLRRASVAAMIVALAEWVAAPIIFYLIGGIPLCYLYVSLSLFVRITASDSGAFVSIFGLIYRFLSLVTGGFLSIIIILSACFTTGGRPMQAVKGGLFSATAAMAFAQNITIGGAHQNRYGEAISAPWIGPKKATAKVTHKDVLRVTIHYGIALFFILVILFIIYAFG